MALKPDREIVLWDVSNFVADITQGGGRGGVVCATGTTAPSGAAMDNIYAQVCYFKTPSGQRPMGMMMSDVVNVDLTRQILNPGKSEHLVGDKVPLMVKGWAVTNQLYANNGAGSTASIVAGASAYLCGSGLLTADPGAIYITQTGTTTSTDETYNTEFPKVGKFLSKADQDGYAKVFIDL